MSGARPPQRPPGDVSRPMHYPTVMADYTGSALRDDFAGPVDPYSGAFGDCIAELGDTRAAVGS